MAGMYHHTRPFFAILSLEQQPSYLRMSFVHIKWINQLFTGKTQVLPMTLETLCRSASVSIQTTAVSVWVLWPPHGHSEQLPILPSLKLFVVVYQHSSVPLRWDAFSELPKCFLWYSSLLALPCHSTLDCLLMSVCCSHEHILCII